MTFNPGVYVIRGGEFSASGTSELHGTGVTFYLTERNGDYATLDLRRR